MDCKTARDWLPLYFDGELDRDNGREFETHLDGCADCRAELIRLDALRGQLRDDAPRYAAPQSLRSRLRNELSASNVARRRPAPPRWIALAASWVVAFAAGGMLMAIWNTTSLPRDNTAANGENQMTRDLFASHWRALAATSPVDVVSTDRHTVKPWFAGKVGAAPIVQDFADRGFALVGGRIDYAGEERVPVLVYRHGQHLIDVFVLRASEAPTDDGTVRSQGYQLKRIRLGDQNAAVVSDLDANELTRFSALLAGLK